MTWPKLPKPPSESVDRLGGASGETHRADPDTGRAADSCASSPSLPPVDNRQPGRAEAAVHLATGDNLVDQAVRSYLRGYSDGFEEGINFAMEQLQRTKEDRE